MDKLYLDDLYLKNKLSVPGIAKKIKVSENTVNYWLKKHGIVKRSISEAIYLKYNPNGHPFLYKEPKTEKEWMLFGLGVGLYWGEGNKRNKTAVKLGNTDPDLIKVFLKFLNQFYRIEPNRLKFGLQVFSDISPDEAKLFWVKSLGIKSDKFYKVTVTPSRAPGTYRHKNIYGVLTVYFNNTFLKKEFDRLIENFRSV